MAAANSRGSSVISNVIAIDPAGRTTANAHEKERAAGSLIH
jgi:hypothetical protein